jgi:hypothetical protein
MATHTVAAASQLTLPLQPDAPAEQHRQQDVFLQELMAASTRDVPSQLPRAYLGPGSPHAAGVSGMRGDGSSYSPQSVSRGATGMPVATTPVRSPLAPVRGSASSIAMAAPWVSPCASESPGAAASSAGLQAQRGNAGSTSSPPHDSAAQAAARQAVRPSTLPAPRSWNTGIRANLGELQLPPSLAHAPCSGLARRRQRHLCPACHALRGHSPPGSRKRTCVYMKHIAYRASGAGPGGAQPRDRPIICKGPSACPAQTCGHACPCRPGSAARTCCARARAHPDRRAATSGVNRQPHERQQLAAGQHAAAGPGARTRLWLGA